MSANVFLEAVAKRRSHYALDKKEIVSRDRIEEIINQAVVNAPSAMNAQSSRVVVLFGAQHDRLWNIVQDTLKKIVPDMDFKRTKEKLDSFKAGYGTVLFYEDTRVIRKQEEDFALYKDNFVPWAHQGNGILQFIIWTALESEGLGASIQHYNPLIDEEVAEAFGIHKDYKLLGQLVFGNPVSEPGEKTTLPLSERVTVIR
ncbi:nitroreductase family protein [Proteiniclasticum sp. C24MP]|uniref:nitroreductase family protein n=1 Tax=Proteiniclasticum sp. C24MP TaxID=3374101 RepID=UPI0037540042